MNAIYVVYIDDPVGNRLIVSNDWFSLDYVRSENDVGTLTLKLPGYYNGTLFLKDGLIEVWRSIEGGQLYLDTETVWMIRRKDWHQDGITGYWIITAYCLNHLLKRRIVDYQPDTVDYSAMVEAADDMGKIIMRQNFGTLATDTTRSIAMYLNIQEDSTLAPVLNKSFARQYVNQVLKDIALASYQKGTYLVFDIVCSVPPASGSAMQFQFRSYIGQRGVDHTFPNGFPPLLIGPGYNNLENVDMDDDSSDEITRGIATGQGYGSIQAVARVDDLSRQGESPFGLIEGVRNASGTDNGTGLTDEAEAELQSGIPRKILSGSIVNTSGLLYGLDWKWGDLVTAQANGESFECHIPRVHVHVERDSGEHIEGILRGSVVTEG